MRETVTTSTDQRERPTALSTPVDVSGNTRRASAASAGRLMRTVTCACGGTIRGDIRAPAAYVAAHNRSVRHRDWRALREYDDFLDGLIAEKVTRPRATA